VTKRGIFFQDVTLFQASVLKTLHVVFKLHALHCASSLAHRHLWLDRIQSIQFPPPRHD
jgi:hypothetical protein